MTMQHRPGGLAPGSTRHANFADLLERILDNGLVIEAWVRCSLAGVEVLTCQAGVVVASMNTYLKYAEAIAQTVSASAPSQEGDHWQQSPADDLAAYLKGSSEGDARPRPSTWYKISPN